METQDELVDKLIQYDIRKYLHSLNLFQNKEIVPLDENEISILCNLSSILALPNDDEKQMLAYEIITKLYINFHHEYPNLYTITYSILSRLGNFPNRDYLKTLIDETPKNEDSNFLIDLEIIAREAENTIYLQDNNQLLSTDFQKQFFNVLTKKKTYSVSAPTSAGKSFIFILAIVQRLLKNDKEIIILVVPTRALIKELSEKIIRELKKYNLFNKIDVRTVPIEEDEVSASGRVYVLTQERLNALLEQENISIDTCFIDEAQEIQNNRGVVLQNTIEQLLKKFPDVNIFFASPLIENPNYFNELFDLHNDANFSIEQISPVGQNILFLSQVNRQPEKIKIELMNSNSRKIDLGIFDSPFRFRDNNRIIELAQKITREDEMTLIYCNGASEAEKRALKLSEELEEVNDNEILTFIDFIKEDIHHEYSIIKCLKKGVAYHYGKMPTSIRTEIEQLASKGKLSYICCTSTLLQGVNLPAKNIIVYKPKKGNGNPMKRADFLNLIGRAGRLKFEFQGNIWCIEPNEWEEKSYEGEKLQRIESFFDTTLEKNIDKLLNIVDDKNNEGADYISVFGKFYSDFVIDQKPIDVYQNNDNYKQVKELLDKANKIQTTLTDEIIKKHYTIHPARLQKMYDYLYSQNGLSGLIPKKAFQQNANKNLKNIFKTINEIFLNKNDNQYTLYSLFANKWIHGKPLKEIINEHQDYYNIGDTNKAIREVLNIIEDQVRYVYVVNTHAYIDILKVVISERNPDFDLDTIPNLPLYLECGTSDPIILNLISLGLSRLTSIKLKNSRQFVCEEPSVNECFKALQNINIDILDIPEVCKREIKGLVL